MKFSLDLDPMFSFILIIIFSYYVYPKFNQGLVIMFNY